MEIQGGECCAGGDIAVGDEISGDSSCVFCVVLKMSWLNN